jgi:hypothetical protein
MLQQVNAVLIVVAVVLTLFAEDTRGLLRLEQSDQRAKQALTEVIQY